VKIEDVLARVRGNLGLVPMIVDAYADSYVRETLAVVGLAIAKDGEVYDPKPAPPPAVVPRDERGVRWSGSGRARRRR
jgi:hypothetical protein